MRPLERLLDLLPPPYAAEAGSVVAQLLGAAALEMEAIGEDVERVRRTHWVRLAYQLRDLEKLGALVGVSRLPWETLPTFRDRLLALVAARLEGALGPKAIRSFVYDYLRSTEESLGMRLVPGLDGLDLDDAFADAPPPARRLALVENPLRPRRSRALADRGGRVPYLFRWREHNRGLGDAVPTLVITGFSNRRTTVPIVANLTTGELLGWAGTVPAGGTLVVRPRGDAADRRAAAASLDGEDATGRLFSVAGYVPGVPFRPDDLDDVPRLPALRRGENRLVYLAVGLYDLEGLDRTFFAIADDELREGVFDETAFDRSLFPSGDVARLEMRWDEEEGASFEIRVPRHLVDRVELEAGLAHDLVGGALETTLDELRAAGVRSRVRFVPFTERQPQRDRLHPSWVVLDPETGPAGRGESPALGGLFGETGLGRSRFE